MEHIQVTELESGYYRLLPDEGYILAYGMVNPTYHSEAVVKDLKGWYAVKK